MGERRSLCWGILGSEADAGLMRRSGDGSVRLRELLLGGGGAENDQAAARQVPASVTRFHILFRRRSSDRVKAEYCLGDGIQNVSIAFYPVLVYRAGGHTVLQGWPLNADAGSSSVCIH